MKLRTSWRFHPRRNSELLHNLHGKVSACEFAKGCADEQRKLYGSEGLSMKICDVCETADTDCENRVLTYLLSFGFQYTPQMPEQGSDYRQSMELCESCAKKVALEIERTVVVVAGGTGWLK